LFPELPAIENVALNPQSTLNVASIPRHTNANVNADVVSLYSSF
jgi:hypothetical protein